MFGLGAGSGAGYLLRPPPAEEVVIDPGENGGAESESHSAGDMEAHGETSHAETDDGHSAPEFVKLNNQFVVPVVEGNDVTALVILSISLEVTPGSTEAVFQREPKLRDEFLQVLFDHANTGGFSGTFTSSNNMEVLRGALLEAARKSLGPTVRDVLIIDFVRQDT
ncbi:MAG: flagellar basal body-associated FliL family protein [Rhodobacteraceae bacterium]|nr:flagellar basal body-associated FliL family protein [Paracoccaceae bacterium]